jgi:hypothetical protein
MRTTFLESAQKVVLEFTKKQKKNFWKKIDEWPPFDFV